MAIALCQMSRLALGGVRAMRTAPTRSNAASRTQAWSGAALLQLSHRELLGSRLQAAGHASAFTSAAGGSMNSELITTITSKIGTALETDRVNVVDVNGDGRHIAINVVSPAFEGKNLVSRQRMVYKAIWLELQEAVHAVDAMTTKTPAEADGS